MVCLLCDGRTASGGEGWGRRKESGVAEQVVDEFGEARAVGGGPARGGELDDRCRRGGAHVFGAAQVHAELDHGRGEAPVCVRAVDVGDLGALLMDLAVVEGAVAQRHLRELAAGTIS